MRRGEGGGGADGAEVCSDLVHGEADATAQAARLSMSLPPNSPRSSSSGSFLSSPEWFCPAVPHSDTLSDLTFHNPSIHPSLRRSFRPCVCPSTPPSVCLCVPARPSVLGPFILPLRGGCSHLEEGGEGGASKAPEEVVPGSGEAGVEGRSEQVEHRRDEQEEGDERWGDLRGDRRQGRGAAAWA